MRLYITQNNPQTEIDIPDATARDLLVAFDLLSPEDTASIESLTAALRTVRLEPMQFYHGVHAVLSALDRSIVVAIVQQLIGPIEEITTTYSRDERLELQASTSTKINKLASMGKRDLVILAIRSWMKVGTPG